MSKWFEDCPHCGEAFSVDHKGGGGPIQDREDIDCPHCKKVVRQKKTSGIFDTAPLNPAEQKRWADEKARQQ